MHCTPSIAWRTEEQREEALNNLSSKGEMIAIVKQTNIRTV